MNDFPARYKRLFAGILAGAMALAVTPILGLTGTAHALEPAVGEGSVCENTPDQDPFTDVADTDPSVEEIRCLVATEITVGVTATTYEPNSPVTRRQMVLFLERLADTADQHEIDDQIVALPAGDGATPFTDIGDENAEVQQAVDRLHEAGITDGVTATTFDPDGHVSRRQMAKFLVDFQDYVAGDQDITPNSSPDAFSDDDGDSGEDELEIVAEEGVFVGDADGDVNPGDDISRRQMANVLVRKAQYVFEQGLITQFFVDVPVVPGPVGPPPVTPDTTAPGATASSADDTVIVFAFDEDIDCTTYAEGADVTESGDTETIVGSACDEVADTITVTLDDALEATETVTVLQDSIEDLAGNPGPPADVMYTAPDRTAPGATASSADDTVIVFTFDEGIDCTTYAEGTDVTTATDTEVIASSACDDVADTITVTLDDALEATETVTVLQGSIDDLAGNPGPPADVVYTATNPTIISAVADTATAQVTLTYSEPVVCDNVGSRDAYTYNQAIHPGPDFLTCDGTVAVVLGWFPDEVTGTTGDVTYTAALGDVADAAGNLAGDQTVTATTP